MATSSAETSNSISLSRAARWGSRAGDLLDQAVKLGGLEGLLDVAAGPHLEAADRVLFLPLGGDDDDRDVLVRRLLLDALQELQPVHDRHVDVEQDEVDALLLRELVERLQAVHRAHQLAALVAGEEELVHLVDERGVVDGEDLPQHAPLPTGPPGGFYHLSSCVSSSQAVPAFAGRGIVGGVFESKTRLQEDARRLLDALRDLGEGRYAALFDRKGILLESPGDPGEGWPLRRFVQSRGEALFRLPAALHGGEEMKDVFEDLASDGFFMAFLNGRVGILVACDDPQRLEDQSGRLLKVLADRLLRLDPSWRLDERGRGLFFGSPRLDTVVIG